MRLLILIFLFICPSVLFSQVGKELNEIPTSTNSQPAIEQIKLIEENSIEEKKTNESVSRKKAEADLKLNANTQQKIQLEQNFQRYLINSKTQLNSRTPSLDQQKGMQQVIDYYKQNFPNSFEYHYFSFAVSGYDLKKENHLIEARKLKPKNSDVLMYSAQIEWIKQNKTSFVVYVDQLRTQGKLIQDVLVYDSLLLKQIPKNSVLITHGFDDGIGSFYLQSKGFRNDITVLSLDLMQSPQHRETLQKQGFVIPKQSNLINDLFLEEFMKLNSTRKIYVSMTFPKPYLVPLEKQLSIDGLAFSYNTFDHSVEVKNVNFVLDPGFKKTVNQTISFQGKNLLSNFLPVCWTAREFCRKSGDLSKMNEIDLILDQIALKTNKLEVVQSWRNTVR